MLWPFSKTETDKLMDLVDRDLAKLEKLRAEREVLLPRWRELQDAAELTGARLLAHASTKPDSTDFKEGLSTPWEEHGRQLSAELEDLKKRRDAVLRSVNLQIAACRDSIVRRNSVLTGGLSSWASRVAQASSDESLVTTLQDARRRIEKMALGRVPSIVGLASETIELVEKQPGFEGPVCRLQDLVQQALEQPVPAPAS